MTTVTQTIRSRGDKGAILHGAEFLAVHARTRRCASARGPGGRPGAPGPVPGAHVDTFARDHLPPPELWPELILDDPAPHYPDRLNCGRELLDRTVEEYGPDRPALRSDDGSVWSYGELRETADRIARVLTEDLGVVPGNRVLLRGPTTPGWPRAGSPS